MLSTAAERFLRKGDDWAAFFETVRSVEAAVELLAEYKPDQDLETNVEFYTATLMYGVGIPKALFSATFGVARVGGGRPTRWSNWMTID